MFGPTDVNINPTGCTTQQGMNRLAQSSQQLFQQLATGSGTVFRFKLTNTLAAGGAATANILKWNGSTFQVQSAGTVHDEEPGGYWSGAVNDEGWCTGRDGSDGHYSIVMMEKAIHQDIINTVNTNATPARFCRAIGPSDGATRAAAGNFTWSSFADSGSGNFSLAGDGQTINIATTGVYRYLFGIGNITGVGGSSSSTNPQTGIVGVGFSAGDFSISASFFTWKGLLNSPSKSGLIGVTSAPSTVVAQWSFSSAGDFTGVSWIAPQLAIEKVT